MRKLITLIMALVVLGYFSMAEANHSHTLNQGNQAQVTIGTVVAADTVGVTGALTLIQNMTQGLLVLKVTDRPGPRTAPGFVGHVPTLDVWVQTSHDQGTSWTDLARFSQVTSIVGPDGTKRYISWNSMTGVDNTTTDEFAISDKSISAGVVNQIPLGNQLRLAYTSVGPSAAWDFSVDAFLRQ